VSTSAERPRAGEPRITVIYLLYNAAGVVPALVDLLARQVHPSFPRQSDWLEALFMDDHSTDGTERVLDRCLEELGRPSHYHVVANPQNLGLSGTLNKAFGLARSPYALTCHLDCRFGRDDYVASMLDLMERHPRAAAITGQPVVPPGVGLPLAEKLNLVANLMDVLPAATDAELVTVGFAEGRCDAFRIDALRTVGLYDTTLRVAGEDQVLAAKLRDKGYEIYQAPRLTYHLSVSGEQDTVGKLARHQRLFGRAHPYIVILHRGSRHGIASGTAGANRRRRALLRATQVAASGVYAFVLAVLLAGWPAWLWGGALVALALVKAGIFARHLRAVRLTLPQLVLFGLVQPLLDLSYTVGLVEGVWLLLRGAKTRAIS
jgi:glycosyltransferase involved in cell wall biosynthesis